jgi:glucose-6-phosphate 1-epimerase
MNIEQLNSDYEIRDQLEFVETEHGFVLCEINNAMAHATICTYSGQVLSYRPKTEAEDLLFVSESAYYETGKAIKGGVPVCWPWFGPDPEQQGRPAHGFVRNRQWYVLGTESLPSGATLLRLGLADSDETHQIWPHSFHLSIDITVGKTLKIELVTQNSGNEDVTISQALHTYFRVGDISKVKVLGLEDRGYLDKVGGGEVRTQSGPVTISGEVDRIYLDVPAELVIDDAALGRKIHIKSDGCSTAVVWNPWIKVAKAMADLGDDDYKNLLCVETANAGPETVEVPAGGEYSLTAEYRIER